MRKTILATEAELVVSREIKRELFKKIQTMRLIDADALREVWLASDDFDNDAINAVLYSIDEAPTVDAEPVRHGQWKLKYGDEGVHYYCSQCREESLFDIFNNQEKSNYCPHCGAIMDEKVE